VTPRGKALVLGGGGVTGVAWELGLLSGLAQAGLSLGDADLVVGTSAGSVVAVHVASHADLEVSYARQIQGPGNEIAARLGGGLVARLVWAAVSSASPARFGQRMGRLAEAAVTLPEAERREVVASRLPTRTWPERALFVTAVDAQTGERRVFTRDDGVPLGDAVAASCAVPGVWPPVTLQERKYIDGGMWSATNADLVAGAARVVIVAPITLGIGVMPSVAAHVDELRRGGTQVVVVRPNRASRRAIGRNALDPARRAPAAQAGRTQAAEELERVRAVWQGA
jgi:NTE family protein